MALKVIIEICDTDIKTNDLRPSLFTDFSNVSGGIIGN
jgi:hypothetical protein